MAMTGEFFFRWLPLKVYRHLDDLTGREVWSMTGGRSWVKF